MHLTDIVYSFKKIIAVIVMYFDTLSVFQY